MKRAFERCTSSWTSNYLLALCQIIPWPIRTIRHGLNISIPTHLPCSGRSSSSLDAAGEEDDIGTLPAEEDVCKPERASGYQSCGVWGIAIEDYEEEEATDDELMDPHALLHPHVLRVPGILHTSIKYCSYDHGCLE